MPVTAQKRVGGDENALDLLPLEARRIEGAGDHSNETPTNSEFAASYYNGREEFVFQPEG